MTPISKPMLFSGENVPRLLDDSKTQSRRIMKPQPAQREGGISFCHHGDAMWSAIGLEGDRESYKCPHPVGSEIWVKETWRVNDRDWDDDWLRVGYKASPEPETTDSSEYTKVWSPRIAIDHYNWPDQFRRFTDRCRNKWRPSIFMPRWASRITLEVTEVRVERLNSISEEDAKAEGVEMLKPGFWKAYNCKEGFCTTAKRSYETLWNEINGIDAWQINPWVWAYSFRRVMP